MSEGEIACPICDGTLQPNELEAHVACVHRCPLCPMRLPNEQDRYWHVARVHGKVQELPDHERRGRQFDLIPVFSDLPEWRSPLENGAIPTVVI